MDDQIASVMFDTVAKEVVSYSKESFSEEELTDRLKSKLSFFERMSLERKPGTVDAYVTFFADDSKKQRIEVHVACERTERGIFACGGVTAGKTFYVNWGQLYKL